MTHVNQTGVLSNRPWIVTSGERNPGCLDRSSRLRRRKIQDVWIKLDTGGKPLGRWTFQRQPDDGQTMDNQIFVPELCPR